MKLLSKIILLLSFLFYIYAPLNYNHFYCTILFVFFIFNVYICTKEDFKSKFYFSFCILFSISFFLTTFAYPVFIKDIESIYLFGFSSVNDKYITKSTALAQFAFSLFSSAYFHTLSKRKKHTCSNLYKDISKLPFKSLYNILLVPITIYFFYELIKLLQTSGEVINYDAGVASTLLITITALFSITFTYNSTKTYANVFLFIKENLVFYLTITFVVLSLLYIGDRGIVIVLLLLLLSTYQYYIKRIKLKIILPFGLLGIILLFLIGETRSTEYSLREKGMLGILQQDKEYNKWDYFSDLTSITRNLYDGYEYANTHEPLYPGKFFIIAASPIPYLPTMLSQLFYNKEFGELSSGKIITNYTANKMNINLSGGLGTHCVSDVYMSWGVFGIFVFYSLLGFITGRSRKRLKTSILAAFTYFILVAYALYIPRSTIFISYDVIGKSILLFLILNSMVNKNKLTSRFNS